MKGINIMVHILVVEDDAALNKTVCSYLNNSGFLATGCLSGEDGLDTMYNELYNLIVSDIMMPGMDGFEFAFMAGSVFAITGAPPRVMVCILLAVPGFAGWILPYFMFRWAAHKKAEQVNPMIERKREEVYEICEKGHKLLQ